MTVQLVRFEISSEVIEVFHVREDIELLVAGKQVTATGEVGEHSLCETTVVPVHTPHPIAGKIVMERLRPTLIEANLKNFKGKSDRGRDARPVKGLSFIGDASNECGKVRLIGSDCLPQRLDFALPTTARPKRNIVGVG